MKIEPKDPLQASTQNSTETTQSRPTLRTVFLDRDGVINRKMPEGQYVTSWQHFDLLPGVPEAIARLNQAGLRVLVVTNQRGVALGLYTAADVDAMHTKLQRVLSVSDAHVDGFYFCPHDKHQCNCRKPLPGLFEQAKKQFPEIEPATSLVIGDSLSDIEFGHNLGLQTIFLEGDESHRQHQKPGASKAADLADRRFPSLPDAVDYLLA
ncbi:D-glycero-alpha-D-manno-heptose-1,7-bisphosphate 7-phosphatase [Acidicapsa acidisoli]|uniref:D-glycero-alpha-D-manno-heptose-1,7-bisphosphate 7-phosphatase n=1 Tax=Acidicapsa acidisoli TaxID=1615681 RepID=UPI0021DFFBEB|nr:HAD family hydrolase [Acidicapsa acidisoli]